eukprot:m.184391 g.184391  ORF g.184391 m.184391 type:complete len:463 (-) comp16667_c3_seq1:162-1550(-)
MDADQETEQFVASSTLPTSQQDLDAYLSSVGGPAHSDLARQSLYVKFDPLVSATPPRDLPPTPTKTSETPRASSKLLDLQTPDFARVRRQQESTLTTPKGGVLDLLSDTPEPTPKATTPATTSSALEETKKRLSQLSRASTPRSSFLGSSRDATSPSKAPISSPSTVSPVSSGVTPGTVPATPMTSTSIPEVNTTTTQSPVRGRNEPSPHRQGQSQEPHSEATDIQSQPLSSTPQKRPSSQQLQQRDRLSTSSSSPTKMPEDDRDAKLRQYKEELTLAQMEIEELQDQLKKAKASNLEMSEVVLEYEKTLNQLVSEKSAAETGDAELRKKVETLEQDLRSTETAFSDLHRKYENQKRIADNLRENEEKLKEALQQAQQAYAQTQESYTALKQHAEDRIQAANVEIARVREENKAQLAASNAKIRKLEVDIAQLKRQLEAKEADNKELTSICEDLVKQLEGAM